MDDGGQTCAIQSESSVRNPQKSPGQKSRGFKRVDTHHEALKYFLPDACAHTFMDPHV